MFGFWKKKNPWRMSGIEATKAEIEMKDGRIAAARALCEKQLQ